MDQARFSVYRFLEDGSCDFVRKDVNVEAAVNAFAICVGVQNGSTRRVIILVGDCVHIEWTSGGGISYSRKATCSCTLL
jgi:hypothetical protein